MRTRLSSLYLALGLLAVVAMALLPLAEGLVVFGLVAVSGLVATWAGARLWSTRRRPWHLVVVGELLCLLGTGVRALETAPGSTPSPLPSPADVFYLAGYLSLIGAVLAFGRARRVRHDGADLVDSLIVSAGVGVPIWLFAMTSFARQTSLPADARVLAVVYSVLTLLMLGGVSRMALGVGVRNRSYYLLVLGFAALIVVDVLTTMSAVIPALADVASLLGAVLYILPAAAALHPSMRATTEPATTTADPARWTRLVALLGALLVAPVSIVAARAFDHRVDATTIVVGAAVVSILVVVRMWLVVLANDARVRRERALRKAGETFVACTTRDQMLMGALAAVTELGAGLPDLAASVVSYVDDDLVVAASTGAAPASPGPALRAALDLRRPSPFPKLPGAVATGFVFPLISQNEVRGGLLVRAARPLGQPLLEALTGLASELSLALETATLVADLHRQHSERRFQALIERSSDMIVILDAEGVITYLSPGFTRVLGYEIDDVVGQPMQTILHAGDSPTLARALDLSSTRAGDEQIELRAADVAGDWHVIEATATNLLHDPDVAGIVLNARDITERKRLADELRHQALHDTLTGLANRALLGDRVAHALTRRSDGPGLVAVLFIDLDDFKTVNDSLGHSAGDHLLVLVSERLRSCLRSADTAARLGGDEFAILLDEPDTESQVVVVADRILAALHRPFVIDDREVIVTASVGIAVDPARAASADHLLRNADAAMYLAKQRGKGRWEMFDEAMHAQAVDRLELKADLVRAIDHDELLLNYQPIVELETGRTVAVEALVRWMHPTRGLVPPAQFIPVAEETGLIVPMGRWILESACRDLVSRPGWDRLGLTVNVSVRQLQERTLVEDVLAALATTGLPAARLTIEITESILMTNTEEIRNRLSELRGHGIGIAIDDFGSGYSSLGYLQRFPVDVLKLDRSFVEDLQLDRTSGGVVRGIVELAEGLGLRLVAEGIETVEQAAALRRRGCRYGQGFLYSRPVAADELDRAVLHTTGVGVEGGLVLS